MIQGTSSRTIHCLAVCIVVVLSYTNLSYAGHSGSIGGAVLDKSGAPVQGATVYANPMDRPIAGIIPHAVTDQSGSFRISTLDYGRYSVSAAKLDDDYPEICSPFYTGFRAKLTTVTLSAEHPFVTVVLHLAAKPGILKGTVADAVTGKPLNANVEFRWALEPQNFLSGSGLTNAQFRILVPSNNPITMVVSLEGYEDWKYQSSDGPKSDAILLRPGEELRLDIRLLPKP